MGRAGEDSLRCDVTASPHRFGQAALVAAIGLLLASLLSRFVLYHTRLGPILSGASGGLLRVFDSNSENSLPTWFAIVGFLLCCALLFIIARTRRLRGDRFASHWLGLAGLFLALSIDEGASFHELATRPLRELLDAGGLLYYTWVIPGALFVVAFTVVYARFLLALPRRTRALFVLSGFTFLAGVIGMELVGGWYDERHGSGNMGYAILTGVEECLEMLGTGLFLYTLLDYMERHVETFTFTVGETRRPCKEDAVTHRPRVVIHAPAIATGLRPPNRHPAGDLRTGLCQRAQPHRGLRNAIGHRG